MKDSVRSFRKFQSRIQDNDSIDSNRSMSNPSTVIPTTNPLACCRFELYGRLRRSDDVQIQGLVFKLIHFAAGLRKTKKKELER